MANYINVITKSNIARVVLNRQKVNAMNYAFLKEVQHTFEDLHKDNNVKGIVITSHNPACFSAGLDLKDVASRHNSPLQQDEMEDFMKQVSKAYTAPITCFKPIAAVIKGHAIAGGLVLGLASDYIAFGASSKAKVGIPELNVGVPFPKEIAELARNSIGNGRAFRKLAFESALVSPNEAFEMGVGDSLTESPEDDAMRYLDFTSNLPPSAFEISKKQHFAPFFRSLRAHNEIVEDESSIDFDSPFLSELRKANIECMFTEAGKARLQAAIPK